MPWRLMPMKDVASQRNAWGSGEHAEIPRYPNGATRQFEQLAPPQGGGNQVK